MTPIDKAAGDAMQRGVNRLLIAELAGAALFVILTIILALTGTVTL